jgi:general stress protein 26
MIDQEKANTLWDLVKPIKTGMLVTNDNSSLNARPMHLVQDEFDGTFYFYTSVDSSKVDELKKNPDVCIAFSCPKTQVFVSISAHASITQDRSLIEKFWNPFVAAWFTNGKDDPTVGLIKIVSYKAESWNSTQNTFVQLYEYAKAALSDKKPNLGEHQKF